MPFGLTILFGIKTSKEISNVTFLILDHYLLIFTEGGTDMDTCSDCNSHDNNLNCFPIPIPKGDPVFPNNSCMAFGRSLNGQIRAGQSGAELINCFFFSFSYFRPQGAVECYYELRGCFNCLRFGSEEERRAETTDWWTYEGPE